ncbi:hypothetical protein [Limnofasciculus baicalensis]|nr:hypothetical protein [Limnofasciculus baicalensis]
MAISSNIIQKLLPLLRPLMEDKKERRGHLNRALINVSVLNSLDWDMPVDTFITDMVKKLHDFGEIVSGKPALCALLIEIRQYVGVDKQVRINELIVEVQTQGEFLPNQTPPNLLFDLLLQIDFKQQARLVRKVIDRHRTAAFLVHGEPYCGQQLLVNRLFRLKSEWKKISPIKIDVSHNGAGRSISHLWRQLASWFRLPKDVEPKEIIQKICDRLFTQDVILIFYTVDYMPPKVLMAWLQEFWEPLVAEVEENCPHSEQNTH